MNDQVQSTGNNNARQANDEKMIEEIKTLKFRFTCGLDAHNDHDVR